MEVKMAPADASLHRPSQARSMFRRFSSRAAGDTSGVAAIEFGIIVPILVLMTVATVDLGMGFYRKMQVEGAAQAGAEWAIRHGFNISSISNAVTSATSAPGISVSPAPIQFCGCASGSGITTATCGNTCSGGVQAGTYTTVSAQMTYNPILPYGFLPSTYNLSSQSTVRLQ
jgi:Flp pilus assembly protein TadG